MPDGLNLAGAGQALDVSLPTIISEFMLKRDVTGVFRNSAESNPLRRNTGTSWIRNEYGRVVAYGLDEAADMNQAQTLSDFATTITPAEVGAQVVIPGSTLRRIADSSLETRVATMLNNAYSLKEDQDGAAQMSSWTSTALGTTSTIITIGTVAAGAARLGVGSSVANPTPAPLPYNYIGHDYQLLHLMGRSLVFTDVPTGTNVYDGLIGKGVTYGAGHEGDGMAGDLMRDGIGALTRMFGVTIKRDANIPVTSTPSATGGIFSKAGLIYVNEVEPHIVKDTSDVSMRDAVELNVWGSYKFGLYEPSAFGIAMTFDCTTPTG